MKIIINKSIFHQIFFTICVVIPFFNNNELSFILWLIALLLTIKKSYSVSFIRYVSCFTFILVLAFVVGLFYQYQYYFVIRDITYLLKPILGLFIGYQFFSNQIKNPFKFLLIAGFVMAIIHLGLVSYGLFYKGAVSVSKIREFGGYFNDYEIYALILLIFYKKFQIELSTKQFRFFFIIMSLSCFAYLARTNFIQFIILFFAMKGYLVVNKKSIFLLSSLILLVVIVYSSIIYYNPKLTGNAFEEFLYKIKNAPIEAFSTKVNRNDWKDFHYNFRSYENIRTIEQLSFNESFLAGEGIGSRIDLKQKVHLGDMYLRYISILHNGYMTILLKSGVIGLFFLLFSIFYFFKRFKPVNEIDNNINRLFVGTGLFLIFSNWVFMGFYNPVDTKSLIIGYLFAYKYYLQKTS
jgi:hypothetical protein